METPKTVRLVCNGNPHDALITDGDGNPLELVLAANVRVGPNGATASLLFYEPVVDVTAELVDLDRLAAAEEVCRSVAFFLRNVTWEDLPDEKRRHIGVLSSAQEAWMSKGGKAAEKIRAHRRQLLTEEAAAEGVEVAWV